MPRITLATAARLTRRHRSTLYRAIRAGRLPRGTDQLVDTADLVRLGWLLPTQEHERPPPRRTPPLSAQLQSALADLRQQLDRLTTQTAIFDRLLTQLARDMLQHPPHNPGE